MRTGHDGSFAARHTASATSSVSNAAAQITRFVEQRSIRTLNVAGPRASGWPQAHEYADGTVRALLALLRRT
jgi:hypothetical protein